ncbi:patatin-like phospholipase family protein [Vibrio sp. WXL103]|uniref:patatin-like phospholipase family protein n=1 Tax=Vibrio sp. WXL103 TaxID=3450710 RepID=UPI003EC52E42
MNRVLVVEGGAMRGIFASGVLGAFLAADYQPFDAVIGVSAGAANLSGYLAGKVGRNKTIITEMATQKRFFDPLRFFKGGNLIDVKWLWECSKETLPINIDDVVNNIPFYVSVTDINNGQSDYYQLDELNIDKLIEATTALPLVYKDSACLANSCFIDGGVADSIPVIKAYQMGAKEITVILSKPLGYEMNQQKFPNLIRKLMPNHKAVAEALIARHSYYNKTLEFIKNPPQDVTIQVISPDERFNVGRFTRSKSKLEQGYQLGIEEGNKFLTNINIC